MVKMKKVAFWVTFGIILVPALILYSSLPASSSLGNFQAEHVGGQLDIMSTLPGVRLKHSFYSWWIASMGWMIGNFVCTWLFFQLVLRHSQAWIPSLILFLMTVALGPMALFLSRMVGQVRLDHTVVLVVPLIAFLWSLPGLLYFELAFDIQRSALYEAIITLLSPPAAAALALRLVFAYEANHAGVILQTQFPFSSFTVGAMIIILCFDVLVLILWMHWALTEKRQSQYHRLYRRHFVLPMVRKSSHHLSSESKDKNCEIKQSRELLLGMPFEHPNISSNKFEIDDENSEKKFLLKCCSYRWWEHLFAIIVQRLAMCGKCLSVFWNQWITHEILSGSCFGYFDRDRELRRGAYRTLDETQSEPDDSSELPSDIEEEFSEEDKDGFDVKVPVDAAHKQYMSGWLAIRRLTKSYATTASTSIASGGSHSAQKPASVTILNQLTTALNGQCITLLLGSNGAGKSTLLRLLANLDSHYTGDIYMRCMPRHRNVGWCPQQDALFEHLSVLEHMLFMLELWKQGSSDENYNEGDSSSSAIESMLASRKAMLHVAEQLLQEVKLWPQRHLFPHELSGGMKRRLTLTLAFVGHPHILILDEPTSGCDSHTREIIRQVLRKRRRHSAILLSSHHTDDIEVLADRLWFLQDSKLDVDDSVPSVMRQAQRKDSIHPNELGHHKLLEGIGADVVLSIYDLQLSRQFIRMIGIELATSWQLKPLPHSTRSEFRFVIPRKEANRCVTWIEEILANSSLPQQEKLFQLSHPSVFDAICGLYHASASTAADLKDTYTIAPNHGQLTDNSVYGACIVEDVPTNTSLEDGNLHEKKPSRTHTTQRILTLFWLRMRYSLFSSAFNIVPMLFLAVVVLIIATVCKDIRYPKIEIAAHQLTNGLGEILLVPSSHSSNSIIHDNGNVSLPVDQEMEWQRMLPTARVRALDTQTCANSDALWGHLYDEYYHHKDARWGAVVQEDALHHWFATRFLFPLPQSAQGKVEHASNETELLLQQLHDDICSRNTSSVPHRRFVDENASFAIDFCNDQHPSYSLRVLRNYPKVDSNQSVAGNGSDIMLELVQYVALQSDLTLLSNVSTDHAAPLFLKEVLSSLSPNQDGKKHQATNSSSNAQKAPPVAKYRLFSQPLPETNMISSVSLQRGSLGAMICSLCLLLTSVTTVRAIAEYLRSGMKRSLTASSSSSITGTTRAQQGLMTVVEYWLAQYLCEVVQLILLLSITLLAIYLGGDPLRQFFFFAHPTSLSAQNHRQLSDQTVYPHRYALLRTLSQQLMSGWSTLNIAAVKITTVGVENGRMLTAVCRTWRLFAAFACAQTAIAFACLCQSRDANFNQLVLLVGSVGGTMTLKMYLDRQQHIWFYRMVSDLCVYLCPAYAFLTAIFAQFAAVSTALFAPPQSNLSAIAKDIQLMQHCELVLWMQAIVGLLLTILIDGYLRQWMGLVWRWRWHWSAQEMSVTGTWRELQDLGLAKAENQGIELVNGRHLDLHQKKTDDVHANSSTARSMLWHRWQLPRSFRNGLFPVITPSTNRLIHQSQAQPAHKRAPADIEMCSTSPPSLPLICTNNLCVGQSKINGTNTDDEDSVIDRLSLANLSVQIGHGERVAILGMNGGGKTTFFETLASESYYTLPLQGTVQLHGQGVDHGARSDAILLGYVPQETQWLETLTVADLWHLYTSLLGINDEGAASSTTRNHSEPDKEYFGAGLLSRKYWKFQVGALSGGTKKKLALSLAQLSCPQCLILDEVTTGVDPIAARSIIDHLSLTHNPIVSVASRSTIRIERQGLLLASHRIDECLHLCDRILLFVSGRLHWDIPAQTLARLVQGYFQLDVFLSSPTETQHVSSTKPRAKSSAKMSKPEMVFFDFSSDGGKEDHRESSSDSEVEYYHYCESNHRPFHISSKEHANVAAEKQWQWDIQEVEQREQERRCQHMLFVLGALTDANNTILHISPAMEVEAAMIAKHVKVSRFVEYEAGKQWRLTLQVKHSPIPNNQDEISAKVAVWKQLLYWQNACEWVKTFHFREMDLEEVLALLLAEQCH
jgi:ABC-type multidrug transport system ATPase subunit